MGSTTNYIATWDCSHCGTKDNWAFDPDREVKITNCPNCGAPVPERDETNLSHEGNPYKIPNRSKWRKLKSQRANQLAGAGPDWECQSCETLNAQSWEHCVNCGYSKEGNAPPVVGRQNVVGHNHAEEPIATGSGVQRRRSVVAREVQQRRRQKKETWKSKSWMVVVAGLLIIATFYAFFHTSIVPVRVADFSWERSIAIEDFQPRSKGDWEDNVPMDAYSRNAYDKIHHHDQVQVGTEQVAVQRSETYQSGTTRSCSTTNNGNGTFSESCYDSPTYDTRYWTEYETRPVYEDVPRYETWVDYTVDRWGYDYAIHSNSRDHKPYWPDVDFVNASISPEIGDTRTGTYSASYTVFLQEDNGKRRSWEKDIKHTVWERLKKDQNIDAKVNIFGSILGFNFQLESNGN